MLHPEGEPQCLDRGLTVLLCVILTSKWDCLQSKSVLVSLMAKLDGRTLDHKTLETLRLLAVKRVLEDGEAPSEVMRSMGLCRTSIYPWLRQQKKKEEGALRMRKTCGPKPKLTEKQRRQVRRWIVGKDPRQYGFNF